MLTGLDNKQAMIKRLHQKKKMEYRKEKIKKIINGII
jgi:uncharacterized protein YdeI (YjbR/CyaY-like superfamily)